MTIAISNQAYFSTTGPALLYWAPTNSAAFATALSSNTYAGFAYLGTTVKSPDIDQDNAFEPVMNALTGTMIPAEQSFQGIQCHVTCPMNHVSESSLRALKALPYANGTGSSQPTLQDAGSYSFQDQGALSFQDGASFMLVVVYPYPANVGPPGLQNGKRFYCCTWPQGKETNITTSPKIDVLTFVANIYRGSFALNGTFVDNRYTIFDYSVPVFSVGGFPPPS